MSIPIAPVSQSFRTVAVRRKSFIKIIHITNAAVCKQSPIHFIRQRRQGSPHHAGMTHRVPVMSRRLPVSLLGVLIDIINIRLKNFRVKFFAYQLDDIWVQFVIQQYQRQGKIMCMTG